MPIPQSTFSIPGYAESLAKKKHDLSGTVCFPLRFMSFFCLVAYMFYSARIDFPFSYNPPSFSLLSFLANEVTKLDQVGMNNLVRWFGDGNCSPKISKVELHTSEPKY